MKRKGHFWSGVGAAALLGGGLLLLIGALVAIAAYPTMLVLGALHGSNGMSFVPALGFWQTPHRADLKGE